MNEGAFGFLTDDAEAELLALLGLRVDLALVARRVRHLRRADRHRPEVSVAAVAAAAAAAGVRHGDARVRCVDDAAHRQDVHVSLADPRDLELPA